MLIELLQLCAADTIGTAEEATFLEAEAAARELMAKAEERDALREELTNVRPYADCYKEACRALGISNNIIGHVRDLTTKRDALAAHCEQLKEFVDQIKGIADISEGIAGFHQNGELLNWQQVDCMVDVDDLLALTPAASLAAYRAGVLADFLSRQQSFSAKTFGPGKRTKGLIDHITKELQEIEADPTDLTEFVDVILLAFDGFWRHGGKPEDLLPALEAKLEKNMARTWPKVTSEDHAIEHLKEAK